MNGFDNEYRELFLPLMSFNRMPHAVIISGGNEKSRKEAADYLAMWAVCSEQEDSKPCGHCNSCRKASSGIHPDIFIPVPENKSKTISIKNLRDDIIPQFYIKPNDSSVRVFIFSEADTILREDTQNTLLKSIEEPPQDLLFIFTAEKADYLLSTIRSRAQSVSLTAKTETPEEIKNLAREW